MMALYHRDVHGADGQLIDINLIDPLARLVEQSLLTYDQTGDIPRRAGNKWDISAPATPIARATTSGSPSRRAHRPSRCGCSGPSGVRIWWNTNDFADPQRRLARATEGMRLSPVVAARTLEEAMAVFGDAGSPPAHDITDLIDDEQMKGARVFVRIDDDDLDSMLAQAPVPSSPAMRASSTPSTGARRAHRRRPGRSSRYGCGHRRSRTQDRLTF